MSEQQAPAKIIHTMFSFIAPRGVQFVDWHTHHEIRFLKADGKLLLQWWKDTLVRLEQELPNLCEERVVTQCDDCNGHGRTGDNKICMSCYGSGRKGFRPPGVSEKAPETMRAQAPPLVKDIANIASAVLTAFDKEVVAEANRIVAERNKTGKLAPFVEEPSIQVDEDGDVRVNGEK